MKKSEINLLAMIVFSSLTICTNLFEKLQMRKKTKFHIDEGLRQIYLKRKRAMNNYEAMHDDKHNNSDDHRKQDEIFDII
jgi:hypothetical protein